MLVGSIKDKNAMINANELYNVIDDIYERLLDEEDKLDSLYDEDFEKWRMETAKVDARKMATQYIAYKVVKLANES